jgi:hypothetical protein
VWCQYNAEGDLLTELITDAYQISGSTPDQEKEEIYEAFVAGEIKRIVTKPKISAWGSNWQHCGRMITFADHSWERYYQLVRRSWRFGRKKPVHIDIIATEGEKHIFDNMQRKGVAADKMFVRLIQHMNDTLHLERKETTLNPTFPSWLSTIN